MENEITKQEQHESTVYNGDDENLHIFVKMVDKKVSRRFNSMQVMQQSVIDREQDNNDNFPWLLNRDHNR